MTGEQAHPESEELGRINARLRQISDLLSNPDTPDSEAVDLAREAAALVGEALEQTEKAVSGLEQGD